MSQGCCAGQNSYVEKGEVVFGKYKDIPKLAAAFRAPALSEGWSLGWFRSLVLPEEVFSKIPPDALCLSN